LVPDKLGRDQLRWYGAAANAKVVFQRYMFAIPSFRNAGAYALYFSFGLTSRTKNQIAFKSNRNAMDAALTAGCYYLPTG
jgi:hypothetical protein